MTLYIVQQDAIDSTIINALLSINAKTGVTKQNPILWPKYKISKTQDGGWLPFWKCSLFTVSADDYLISMEFGSTSELWFREWSCEEISKFSNSRMVDGRQVENSFQLPQRHFVRLTRNLEGRSRIASSHRSHGQIRNFETSNSRRPPFWKWFYLYFSRESSGSIKFAVWRCTVWFVESEPFYNSSTSSLRNW